MDVESMGAAVTEDLGDDESNTPALFVTTMPRDLWANPSLGALAALIDEAHDEENRGGDQAHGREKAEAIDESNSKYSTLEQQRDNTGDCATKSEELCYGGAGITTSGVRSSSSEGGSIRSTVTGKIRRNDVQRKRNERRASPYGDSAAARHGSKPDRDCEDAGDGLRKARSTPGETQVLMSLWGL